MKTALSFLMTLAALFALALIASSRAHTSSRPELVTTNIKSARNRPDFRDFWIEAAEDVASSTREQLRHEQSLTSQPIRTNRTPA